MVERPATGGIEGRAMRGRLAARLFGSRAGEVKIARFEVLESVGRGGMGVVYLAHDPELGRRVALKVLHTGLLEREVERLRLMREAQALAKLSHPNVVQLYEVGEHGESLYLAMEYVEGVSLREWQAAEPRTWRDVLAVYMQAGAGLAAAHDAGLVHRDFKPANVIIGRDGRVRVADFGLARVPASAGDATVNGSTGASGGSGPSCDTASASIDPERQRATGDATITRPGAVIGTPAYMSPEQLRRHPVDARSDQFSFCVALWEALYGERPYRTDSGVPWFGTLHRPRRRIIGRRALAALERGLAITPSDRFPDLHSLLAHIDPRRRWAGNGMGFFAGGVVVAASTTFFVATDDPPPCSDDHAQIEHVWDQDRAAAVRASFERTGAFAPVGAIVLRRLDDYVHGWRAAWTQACRARIERGTTASGTYDEVQRCLDARRDNLAVLASYLDTGHPEILEVALRVTEDLPAPHRCLSARERELSADEHGLETLAGRRGVGLALDAASLLLDAGRIELAEAQLVAAHEAMPDPGHSTTAARMRLLQARLDRTLGRSEAARAGFVAAAAEATRVDAAEIAFDAWLGAIHVLNADLEQPAAAHETLALAEAALARAGEPPAGVRRHRLAQASVALGAGKAADARAILLEVLAEIRGHEHEGNEAEIRALISLGNGASATGDREEATSWYREAEHTAVLRFGEHHPLVATVRFNLGLEAAETGRPDLARALLESAYAIKRRAFGDTSVRVAGVLTALARLDMNAGDLASAHERASQAWDLQRSGLPAGHSERGSGLALLVNLHRLEGDDARALAGSLELLDEYAVGRHQAELPVLRNNIGWLLCDMDRCAEAEPFFAQVMASTAPGSEVWILAKEGHARVLLERGDPRAAIAILEPLLAVAPERTELTNPLLEGGLHLMLARALRRNEEPLRACEHALDARREYERHGGGLEDIDEFLATCTARSP